MQKLTYIYSWLGRNKDIKSGKDFLTLLACRSEYAHYKHGKEEWDNLDKAKAIEALRSEFEEVVYASENETNKRLKDELLDLMVVAVRIYNCEYGIKNKMKRENKDTVIPEQAKQKFMKKFEEKE